MDQAISENVDALSWIRLDPNEKLKLDERVSVFFNSTVTPPRR